MMIVSKNAGTQGETNPMNRSALDRKGMRRGRQVVLYQVSAGTAAIATIMSPPLDKDTYKPDRENGQLVRLRFEEPIETNVYAYGQLVRLRFEEPMQVNVYSLYELGVAPDETGAWSDEQYLLDRNQYNNQQLREDGSEPLDPPER